MSAIQLEDSINKKIIIEQRKTPYSKSSRILSKIYIKAQQEIEDNGKKRQLKRKIESDQKGWEKREIYKAQQEAESVVFSCWLALAFKINYS